MTGDSITGHISADFVLRLAIGVLAAAFSFGLMLRPYQDLPTRVEALEDGTRTLEIRMIEQERKLDLVICFLEMDANGMNPLACSR